jgi:phosphoglycolate phosphatase-like HAD superfamily hydrolase
MDVFAFDFDGVILDSTKLLRENYLHFLKKYGITPDKNDIDFFYSNTIDNIINYLNEKYKLNLKKYEVEESFFENERSFISNFKDNNHIKKLKDILNYLKTKGFHVIILSHSPYERISYALKNFGLENYFEEIISDERIMTDKVDYFTNYVYYNKVNKAYLIDDSPKICLKALSNNINPFLYYNPLRFSLEEAEKFSKLNRIPLIKNFEELKKFV